MEGEGEGGKGRVKRQEQLLGFWLKQLSKWIVAAFTAMKMMGV